MRIEIVFRACARGSSPRRKLADPHHAQTPNPRREPGGDRLIALKRTLTRKFVSLNRQIAANEMGVFTHAN